MILKALYFKLKKNLKKKKQKSENQNKVCNLRENKLNFNLLIYNIKIMKPTLPHHRLIMNIR